MTVGPGGRESAVLPRRGIALILVLLAIRLPSLVQPAGGDQGLYAYAGQRMMAGDVMYRDMWDQKPPGIAFLYSVLLRVWPTEAMVPAADLVAAGATAFLLLLLGRRRYSAAIGVGAAAVFLFFGDPYLQRLSGIYVRGQCEPFIALAVLSCLVLLAYAEGRRLHLFAAGVALAVAFWLKYNAAAYGVPVLAAAWVWAAPNRTAGKSIVTDVAWIAAGFVLVALVAVAYFSMNGALHDWRLATIDYNLKYSNETYEESGSVVRYVVTFPIERARIDMIWFLGGLGALLIAPRARSSGSLAVVLAWLLAAVISIAVNGSRSLPNYFVQAAPALAMAAAVGLAALPAYGSRVRYAVALLLLAAMWRVGSDTPVWGFRLASLPGLAENVRYDLRYLRGTVSRDDYLRRFSGQKHDALENEQLARYVRDTTASSDPILVFGFSGGSVCWKSGRQSASRFYWSRPVLIEFAADQPGYGSAGLLEDLQRRPPAIVALQKEEWRSYDFFMSNDRLRSWLQSGYRIERETPMFSVWRRTDATYSGR
jgi:hypothetical protein